MNNMEIFISIISATGLLYAILIISFTYGWDRLKGFRMLSDDFPIISIVVAARNEGQNISSLLESLLRQDYPQELYEIISNLP